MYRSNALVGAGPSWEKLSRIKRRLEGVSCANITLVCAVSSRHFEMKLWMGRKSAGFSSQYCSALATSLGGCLGGIGVLEELEEVGADFPVAVGTLGGGGFNEEPFCGGPRGVGARPGGAGAVFELVGASSGRGGTSILDSGGGSQAPASRR